MLGMVVNISPAYEVLYFETKLNVSGVYTLTS